jgi:Integrase core domain
MGIRDTIAPGSPWQNSFAERLIGTIRRECWTLSLIGLGILIQRATA